VVVGDVGTGYGSPDGYGARLPPPPEVASRAKIDNLDRPQRGVWVGSSPQSVSRNQIFPLKAGLRVCQWVVLVGDLRVSFFQLIRLPDPKVCLKSARHCGAGRLGYGVQVVCGVKDRHVLVQQRCLLGVSPRPEVSRFTNGGPPPRWPTAALSPSGDGASSTAEGRRQSSRSTKTDWRHRSGCRNRPCRFL